MPIGVTRAAAPFRMLGGHDVAPFHAAGHAPTLLGLHGFSGTVAEIRPLLERVARAGYAVRAPLLPGHGTSPAELQTKRFGDWTRGAREELDALSGGPGPVVALGFSMGSLVALQLALDAPERVAGLVLLGNALTLAGYTRVPFATFERFGWKVPDAYLLKPRPVDIEDRSVQAAMTSYDRHPMRAAEEVYRAGVRLRRELGRVACPVLVLHGRKDRVCPVSNVDLLAAGVGSGDVRVRVFERSAHVVAADFDREEVAQEVLAFLRRLGAAQCRPVEP